MHINQDKSLDKLDGLDNFGLKFSNMSFQVVAQ